MLIHFRRAHLATLTVALAGLGGGCFERLDVDSVTYACEPGKALDHCGKGWECVPGPAGFHVCQREGAGADGGALGGDGGGTGPEAGGPEPGGPAETRPAEEVPQIQEVTAEIPPIEAPPDATPESDGAVAPEVAAEPQPEPGPEAQPEPGPEAQPEPGPEPGPEPIPEPVAEPIAELGEAPDAADGSGDGVAGDAETVEAPGPACGPWVCAEGFECTPELTCENAWEVYVPGSTFFMGCNEALETGCAAASKPQHEVSVAPFAIGRTEVTVGMYSACAIDGGCPAVDPGVWGSLCHDAGDASELPANCISWTAAAKYCAWAGMRLCSEAEWEKAARGGCELWSDKLACQAQTPPYPWGTQAPSCELAWCTPDGAGPCAPESQPVGGLADGDSAYGALDLAGNVGEWVADCYHGSYFGAPSDGSAWVDTCAQAWRWLRGGALGSPEGLLRSSHRWQQDPQAAPTPEHGFRCCYSVPP